MVDGIGNGLKDAIWRGYGEFVSDGLTDAIQSERW